MMRKVITVGIMILIIFISILLQINFLNVVPLFGVNANLGIILVAGIGLMSGELVGGLVGGIYGLLLDITFSKVIGIQLLLYILVGILTGRISRGFSKDSKMAMAVVVSLTTIIFEFVHVSLLSLLQKSSVSILAMVVMIALEVVYNLILTMLLHRWIVNLGDMINKSKNSYYLL